MSLRQLRKLQEKRLQQEKQFHADKIKEEQTQDTDEETDDEEGAQISKFRNAFSSIPRNQSDSSSQEDSKVEIQQQEQNKAQKTEQKKLSRKQKKKIKKKNKKNKTNNNNQQQDTEVIDQDYKLLQDLRKQLKAKSSPQQQLKDQQYKNSCIKMDSHYFNANKQLSKLFSQTMDPSSASSSYSSGGKRKYKSNMMTQNAEEQKFFALDQYLYNQQLMNKKSSKHKKLLQHLSHRKHTNTILIQPPKYWIPPPPGLIKIKQISQTPQHHPIYTYQKTTSYIALDQQFIPIQQSMNIQMLFQFTQRHPYHVQSLLYIADFFRMQGQFPSALQFLERALFVFEHGVWANSTFSPIKEKHGLPSTCLDIQANTLNGIFCQCLVKYLDVLKRKSCCRTGLQYTKLLLSLDVWQDTYGALLRIDYFGIRAKEYEFLIHFARQYPKQIIKDNKASLLILPNFLYSIALAKLYIDHQNETVKQLHQDTLKLKSNDQLYQCITQIFSLTNLNSLLDLPAQCLLICGMILYPLFLRDLIVKNGADKGQNYVNPQLFQDKQRESWSKLLKQGCIFEGSQGDFSHIEAVHDWICGTPQMQTFPDQLTGKSPEQLQETSEEVISKIRKILIEQSSGIYGKQWIMQRWFKQICGFILNAIQQQIITQEGFIKHINLIAMPCFFLYRYKHLKLSDFAEDISTINPQELQAAMMAAGGGGIQQPLFQQIGEQNHDQQNQPEEQQMQNLMNFLNQNPAEMQQHGDLDEAQLLQQYQLMEQFQNNIFGGDNDDNDNQNNS